MSTFRTLREIRAQDRSNQTLRFNRSLRDVGLSGPIDDAHPTPGGFVGMVGAAVVGSLMLYAFLVLVLA